jgi:hypothetical protein
MTFYRILEVYCVIMSRDMMENEELSIILWFWTDLQTNITGLRVVSVATGKEVPFKGGAFLLHISINVKSLVTRCHIRYIVGGCETYIQGGPMLGVLSKIVLTGRYQGIYYVHSPSCWSARGAE